MAKYIMHWVRTAAGDARHRVRASTSEGDILGGSRLVPRPRNSVVHASEPSTGRVSDPGIQRAPAGGLVGLGTAHPAAAPANGGASTAPSSHRQPIIRSMVWYHGAIDRGAAEQRMEGLPPGTFLVRYSEKKEE
jgi:hypothetical protein